MIIKNLTTFDDIDLGSMDNQSIKEMYVKCKRMNPKYFNPKNLDTKRIAKDIENYYPEALI